MLGHQFAYSAAPTRKVREVQFGILSPEEIKAYSVAKVEHPEVMDETTHRPKIGGLMDPRMGTIDRNFKCQTCGEGMSECSGHFGHIELARPVFHPGFIVKVKKILECVCVNCGKLKADIPENPKPVLRLPSSEGRFPFHSHRLLLGMRDFEIRRTRGQVKWGLNEECESVIQSLACLRWRRWRLAPEGVSLGLCSLLPPILCLSDYSARFPLPMYH